MITRKRSEYYCTRDARDALDVSHLECVSEPPCDSLLKMLGTLKSLQFLEMLLGLQPLLASLSCLDRLPCE